MRRFWCFLGPKLGLLYLSFCGCYIETTTNNSYCEVFPVDWCNCQSLIIADSHANDFQGINDSNLRLPGYSMVTPIVSSRAPRMHIKRGNKNIRPTSRPLVLRRLPKSRSAKCCTSVFWEIAQMCLFLSYNCFIWLPLDTNIMWSWEVSYMYVIELDQREAHLFSLNASMCLFVPPLVWYIICVRPGAGFMNRRSSGKLTYRL